MADVFSLSCSPGLFLYLSFSVFIFSFNFFLASIFLSLILCHFLFSLCFFSSLSLSLSLFAPILISAPSIVESAHPTHAHKLNEILCARAIRACSFDSVNMIFYVFNTCYHKNVCICECMCARAWRRGCVLHHTSRLNIPKCNFLDVKRAGWMFIILYSLLSV